MQKLDVACQMRFQDESLRTEIASMISLAAVAEKVFFEVPRQNFAADFANGPY